MIRRAIQINTLLIGLTACASGPLKPEAPAPDAVRLAQLLAAPIAHPTVIAPATFTLSAPHVILEGNTFYITCYIPASLGPGQIRVALEGVDVSTHPIAGVETSLRVRPSCGTWLATCALQTAAGLRRLAQDVEVRGGLCEGDAR